MWHPSQGLRVSEVEDPGGLLARLGDQIDVTLHEALRGARRVALVNFPNHGNAGDPALWLGAHRSLRRLGVTVTYQCEPRTYEPGALAATRSDAILINGGGNLGDLWAGQQAARERVLADFPDVPTVQLPQSIHFRDPDRLERMQRLVAAHRDLTLLLRDPVSLAFAHAHFDAPSKRCPDLALRLGPLPRAAPATRQVLWLARDDKESTGARPQTGDLDAEVLDWVGTVPDEPPWALRARAALRLNQRLTARAKHDPRVARRAWRALAATYRPLAEARLQRGLAILARGEVVVSDRLHGHVLSLLQGIPHVVLDNSYGKTRALVEADTAASPLVHWAEHPAEALEIARTLVRD